MSKRHRVRRNEPCPCGRRTKFKHCCDGKIDWERLFRTGADWRPFLSVRGRNLHFANRLAELLEIDVAVPSELREYKARFTAEVVREIHELVVEVWPPDSDIRQILSADSEQVSGLYIGDYDPAYIERGIVRHSIYANKILVVDPFIYPPSVRDYFNPILRPDQHRGQTLRNVNFWLSLLPWIDAGIVEIIRTPGDFDPNLNWSSLERQQQKFAESAELREAAAKTVATLGDRHRDRQLKHFLLSAPDDYLESKVKELGLEKDGFTAEDFLKYIEAQRERDPNFLEAVGPGSDGEIHMMTSGAGYEMARITANLTGSYLVTDLQVKWREIELDRTSSTPEVRMWSPFAKAVQEAPLKYLNTIQLGHALRLRQEGRLESLRRFLHRVWTQARSEQAFDSVNAQQLAEELAEEVAKAEQEWRSINADLLNALGKEAAAGILAAGPLIATGNGGFLAGAAAVTGAVTGLLDRSKRKAFPDRHPAAFFMNLDKE